MFNKKYRAAFITLLLLLLSLFLTSGTRAVKTKTFSWRLGLQHFLPPSDFVSFSEPVQAKTGELFRFIIIPDADCYCYIVAESDDVEGAQVLFSGVLKKDERWASGLFMLVDPPGSDYFYIVTSLERQITLEKGITELEKDPSVFQSRKVLDEIKSIMGTIKKFTEKPAALSAQYRLGYDYDMGVGFSGSDLYVKTIVINH